MIYVICNNDSLEAASLSRKKAEKELIKLRKLAFDTHRNEFGSTMAFESYCKHAYWHIHEVKEVG